MEFSQEFFDTLKNRCEIGPWFHVVLLRYTPFQTMAQHFETMEIHSLITPGLYWIN